jgi:hypothetical protein
LPVFRAVYVFDVGQTDGKELPQIGIVHGDPQEHTDCLRTFAEAQGIAVEYSEYRRLLCELSAAKLRAFLSFS